MQMSWGADSPHAMMRLGARQAHYIKHSVVWPLPNGSRLSCGALKKDSFPNLRAPPASSAC
jgi:hypothetical protein